MEQFSSKETVVYGGAFNPPTLAHIAILRACFDYADSQRADVWVLPSGNRLDKTIPTPRQRRIDFIQAMIRDADDTQHGAAIQLMELDRTRPVETIDTVHELRAMYPGRDFRFVFGADSTETMAEWDRGQELLDTLPMLVVERPGSQINPLAKHAVKLEVQTPDISSTLVRAQVAAGGPVDGLVSAGVARLLVS
jgi:nicotinate-nucleotide adenylyltransferase